MLKIFKRNYKFQDKLKLWLPFVLIGLGIFSAINLSWLCDDSFISFRYAKNLINGIGLVYNRGEYVEGYTNFLWTILIAGGMFFHLPPEIFSKILGILFFISTIYVLLNFSKLFSANQFLLPIAAVGFALHHHAQVFATSGLETSMFTFLATAGTYYIFKNRSRFDEIRGMVLFTLAAMTRPDGMLFYVISSLYLLYLKTHFLTKPWLTAKNIVFFSKPHLFFILVFVPYWVWRYNYYGWVFPNTFYAKSGDESFFSRGLFYFYLFFKSYYVFILIPLLSVYNFVTKRVFDKRILLLVVIPALTYIAYFTYIGGDFMFARFYIPILPMLFLLLEYLAAEVFKRKYYYTAFIVISLMVFGYNKAYRGLPMPIISGIADENQIYKPEYTEYVRDQLTGMSSVFKNNDIRIAIGGSQAIFAYYLEVSYALEASGGLTDEFLAHQKISRRDGIIGHEKGASLEYLREKKINLHMNALHMFNPNEYNSLVFKGFPGEERIIIYENKKMEALAKTGKFAFVNFSDYLSKYIRNINHYPKIKIKKDFGEFNNYYFKYNDDSRKLRFIK